MIVPNAITLELNKTYKDVYGTQYLVTHVHNPSQSEPYHRKVVVVRNLTSGASTNYWGDGRYSSRAPDEKDLIEEVIVGVAEPRWFIVWSPQGPTNPQMKHLTFAIAEAEAERLVSLNPTRQYYVLRPVAVATASTTVVANTERFGNVL